MNAEPILVFDSGIGGLTVLAETRKLLPQAGYIYVADTQVFPYGALADEVVLERVEKVIGAAVDNFAPRLAVIACHTASTLVLPALRARFAIPFVGTVPAIKPAAAMTRSRLISVLATGATVKRDYTQELIKSFAGECRVTLVGSSVLASLAEAKLRGEPVSDEAIAAEIAPCFGETGDARTDVVVLACTHYPLLLPEFERLAPWPVTWLDPAPAIARRVKDVLPAMPVYQAGGAPHASFVTGESHAAKLASAFAGFGLPRASLLSV